MAGIFQRLFGGSQKAPESPEQAVLRIHATLPKCTSRLLVAGPAYGDAEYLENLFVRSSGLLPWSVSHAEGTYISDPERQAAVEVLPIWLRSADYTDDVPTKLTESIAANLRPYILDFMTQGLVEIHCRKCNKIYQNVERHSARVDEGPTHSDSTNEWYCGSGHLLYRSRSHTHLVRRPREA